MGKFVKGMIMGAMVGAAFEMMMMPCMDRRTQRNMRRYGRKMRRMANSTRDGIGDMFDRYYN